MKYNSPVCTFLFSILVLFSTSNILRDAFLVFMEGEECKEYRCMRTFSVLVGGGRKHTHLTMPSHPHYPISSHHLTIPSPPPSPHHSLSSPSPSCSLTAVPRHMNYADMKRDLQGIPGVKHTHSLHIWSLTLSRTALAAHLALRRNVM